MNKKSTDHSEPKPVPTPQGAPQPTPEALPGSGPRERATPQGDGLDPTRYGDWEANGRCIDF